MRFLLTNWTSHGEWEQFFSEYIESALRYHLIRQFYLQSEQQCKFNAVLNFFHQKQPEYKINFEEKMSIKQLGDVFDRYKYITHLFNETYNGFGTGLFPDILSSDWNIFQHHLENDKELERNILQSLLDSIIRIDYHNKFLEAIADKICNQFKELPSEAQDLFALTHPKDEHTSKMAFESLLKKSFQKARYINLPDIARDKEWCIPGLIDNKRRQLQEQKIWNQLQWIEKKGKFIVDDILQDLQDEKRRQDAKKRSPHRADNKEYLDEEKLKSNGSKVLTLEFLEGKHESLQTQPLDELPSEADPYDALVADIREVHGNNVAETAEVYFEIYFQQDEKEKKVNLQQVAKRLRKNRKTISRHIEKIENFLRERMKKN